MTANENASSERGAEAFDAIVIGGNVAGLVVAYLLANFGYRTALVERAPQLGGKDASFKNRNGRTFDFGLHCLDYLRSEFTTRLFEHVQRGRVHRVERHRAIVLRNHLIPYNALPEEWPGELRGLFPSERIVDELGAEDPTRERIAHTYGAGFADLIFDETLPSYPSDLRHTQFDIAPSRLMVNIYPWFFPRAQRGKLATDASRSYQDEMREQPREYMLYPDAGGFSAFSEALAEQAAQGGAELLVGAEDLEFAFDANGQRVESVRARGRALRAPRIYWCSAPTGLYQTLGLPAPKIAPDTFVLGSFEFERPLSCDYSEIILGDPEHAINRISFPGKLALEKDNLVQLEFSFPTADASWETKPSFWLETWLRSLQRLGIAAGDNRLVDFDMKRVPMYSNVFGVDGVPIPAHDFSARLGPSSNLRPVLPTHLNVNLNTRVPQYLEFLTRDLLRKN